MFYPGSTFASTRNPIAMVEHRLDRYIYCTNGALHTYCANFQSKSSMVKASCNATLLESGIIYQIGSEIISIKNEARDREIYLKRRRITPAFSSKNGTDENRAEDHETGQNEPEFSVSNDKLHSLELNGLATETSLGLVKSPVPSTWLPSGKGRKALSETELVRPNSKPNQWME